MFRKQNKLERQVKRNTFLKTILVSILIVTSMLISVAMVPADEDDLISRYEKGDKQFQRVEISDMIVYSHKRMIDDAVVEKDYIVYQFDKNTEELLAKKMHWREGLPEDLPSTISKEKVESLIEGEIQSSRLVYISPESEIYKIKPTPENPCWAVRSINKGKLIEIVIDAITGEILGNGITPPYDALSIGGPDHGACAEYYYDPYALNAAGWFNAMGYSTETLDNPDEPLVQGHIQSCETALFYELCHGSSYSFRNDCTGDQSITSAEVATWIEDYTKMPFAFIGSCSGLVDTGPGTFSHAFRKGSMIDTATIGYNHMDYDDDDPYDCRGAWANAIAWQDALFGYMVAGDTVKDAYDKACADFLAENCHLCMKFFGDETLALVSPVAERGELPPTTTKTIGTPTYNGEEYVTFSTKITLDAEDVCSGVKEIHFMINGVETITSSDPFEFYFTSEGTKILEFWAVDNSDNEELPHHTQIHYVDNTAPTTIKEYGTPFYTDASTDWITSSTNIYLNATDGGSVPCGVKEIHYSYDGGTTWYISAGDKAIFNIPGTEPECQHTIQYYSVDNLGNTEATQTQYVYLDNTPPSTQDELGTPYLYYDSKEYITPSTKIYLNATDNPACGCGVREIYYNYGAGWNHPIGDEVEFTIPDDCLHTISWYAVDNLGNVEPVDTRLVDVDGTPPVIDLTEDEIKLWPTNHKYHTIEIDDIVESVVDEKLPVTDVNITSVSSDEPENFLDDNGDDDEGDGDTWDDIVIIDPQTVKLRAERYGSWNGRVYEINFEVSDLIGNKATDSFQIFVPICPKCGVGDDGPEYTVVYP